MFEMEDEQDCGYDFIEVFSGFDDTGPSYGRFWYFHVYKRPFLPKMFALKIGGLLYSGITNMKMEYRKYILP